jgi:hypothetical protein
MAGKNDPAFSEQEVVLFPVPAAIHGELSEMDDVPDREIGILDDRHATLLEVPPEHDTSEESSQWLAVGLADDERFLVKDRRHDRVELVRVTGPVRPIAFRSLGVLEFDLEDDLEIMRVRLWPAHENRKMAQVERILTKECLAMGSGMGPVIPPVWIRMKEILSGGRRRHGRRIGTDGAGLRQLRLHGLRRRGEKRQENAGKTSEAERRGSLRRVCVTAAFRGSLAVTVSFAADDDHGFCPNSDNCLKDALPGGVMNQGSANPRLIAAEPCETA